MISYLHFFLGDLIIKIISNLILNIEKSEKYFKNRKTSFYKYFNINTKKFAHFIII